MHFCYGLTAPTSPLFNQPCAGTSDRGRSRDRPASTVGDRAAITVRVAQRIITELAAADHITDTRRTGRRQLHDQHPAALPSRSPRTERRRSCSTTGRSGASRSPLAEATRGTSPPGAGHWQLAESHEFGDQPDHLNASPPRPASPAGADPPGLTSTASIALLHLSPRNARDPVPVVDLPAITWRARAGYDTARASCTSSGRNLSSTRRTDAT